MQPHNRLTRREFLKLAARFVRDTIFVGLIGGTYGFLVEPFWLETVHVELTLPRLPRSFSGLRLLQLSDIHLGGWMDMARLEQLVAQSLAARPDVIVITGDLIYGRPWDHVSVADTAAGMAAALRPLAKACPVFAVMGNHDHWVDVVPVRQAVADAGIRELINTVHTFERDGEYLHICGLDDLWELKTRLEGVLDVLPPEGAAILLIHEPDFARSSAPTGRFDLQLSGHTHGGQIVLPFIGAPVRPYLGSRYPASGLCQVNDMYLYTNRGAGMGGIPIRFNCRPEITLFTLRSPA